MYVMHSTQKNKVGPSSTSDSKKKKIQDKKQREEKAKIISD